MNWKEILKIIAAGIIGAVIVIEINHYFVEPDKVPVVSTEEIKTGNSVKDVVASAGINLSTEQAGEVANKIKNAKPTGSVNTTAGDLKETAAELQQKNDSDFASVVTNEDLSKMDKDTPVELQQYHIYAASKVLRELGLKADSSGNGVAGVSYGIKRRISAERKYIGVRADYDWNKKEAAVWLTYSW